jgi:hypothetical protein
MLSVTLRRAGLSSSTADTQIAKDGDVMDEGAVVNAGTLQVDGHVFAERMFGRTDDLRSAGRDVKDFKVGVPHGFRDSINRVRDATYKDPALATWIADQPKGTTSER